MIPIKIEYGKKNIELSHPESYNELSPSQFLAVVKYYILIGGDHPHQAECQLLLLQEFLSKKLSSNVKDAWYKVLKAMVKDGSILDLIKLQEFLDKEQVFNNWILKLIKHQGKTYQGPRDRFSFMQFGQFIFADMMFMQYYKSQAEESLNKFIASLFVENIKDDFTTEHLDKKAEKLSSLPVVTKQAILFNYSSVRKWLESKYPFVFEGKEEDKSKQEIILGNSSQSGWLSVRRHLAGDVLNLEKVDKVLLHDVLADLNEKIANE